LTERHNLFLRYIDRNSNLGFVEAASSPALELGLTIAVARQVHGLRDLIGRNKRVNGSASPVKPVTLNLGKPQQTGEMKQLRMARS
jgi:hypothetical protein